MMRVKNEERWIARAIDSLFPLVEHVFLFDDNSTDRTREIAASYERLSVIRSPFSELNEVADKNLLLEHVEKVATSEDVIVHIDGDEMLGPGSAEAIRAAMQPGINCISLRVIYLWNSEQLVRVDGVYGDFHRESVFRPTGARFEGNSNGGNFHCGNVPWQIRRQRVVTSIPLLHFGYMHKDDRERKFHWYRAQDPNNDREDGYRHMVIGDLFPADSQFMHAGPLHLEPLNP